MINWGRGREERREDCVCVIQWCSDREEREREREMGKSVTDVCMYSSFEYWWAIWLSISTVTFTLRNPEVNYWSLSWLIFQSYLMWPSPRFSKKKLTSSTLFTSRFFALLVLLFSFFCWFSNLCTKGCQDLLFWLLCFSNHLYSHSELSWLVSASTICIQTSALDL